MQSETIYSVGHRNRDGKRLVPVRDHSCDAHWGSRRAAKALGAWKLLCPERAFTRGGVLNDR